MATSSQEKTITTKVDNSHKIEHYWTVRIHPNEQSRIIECIEAGSFYNDFTGVFKLGNFYWITFQGASKLSSGNFTNAHFEVKELNEFNQKKGRIVKAIYWTDKEFKGFAVNNGDLKTICEETYKNPDFKRLNDLSKGEIDEVDEPSDTLEMKLKKTESYASKSLAILNTLPDLVEDGTITKKSLLEAVDTINVNVKKLDENHKALSELIASKPGAEKIAETLPKLHPYQKWNQIVVPTTIENQYMKITAVVVDDPTKKPTLKVKLQKVIIVNEQKDSSILKPNSVDVQIK